MFNIGVGEILIVLVVAFVIVGPDDLPRVARWLGRQVRRLKKMIRDIREETGWNELEKEVRDIRRDVRDTAKELDIRADIKSAADDVRKEVREVSADVERDMAEIDRDLKKELETADRDVRRAVGRTEDIPDAPDGADTGDGAAQQP